MAVASVSAAASFRAFSTPASSIASSTEMVADPRYIRMLTAVERDELDVIVETGQHNQRNGHDGEPEPHDFLLDGGSWVAASRVDKVTPTRKRP